MSVDEHGANGYTFDQRLTRIEVASQYNGASLARLEAKADALDRKLDGRPPWSVVWIIAVLQATCGVLASALVILLLNR